MRRVDVALWMLGQLRRSFDFGRGWRWVVLVAVLMVLQAAPPGFGPGLQGGRGVESGRPAAAAAAGGSGSPSEVTRTTGSRVVYSCPAPPSGYSAGRRRGRTCYYSKTVTTSRTATSLTRLGSCPSSPTGYSYSRRSGRTCYYTKIVYTTRTALSRTRLGSCPSSPTGYSYSRRSGRTCYYTKIVYTTRTALSRTRLGSCPSSPSGYSYSRRSGRTCYYTRTVLTTRIASYSWITRHYSCPLPPSGYRYSRRSGRTCYYAKTLTTTRTSSASTTYSCPSAPSGYRYNRRSGRTCYYAKTLTTTRTSSASTTYSCPSAPSGYRYNRRSGRTCYYAKTLTKTLSSPITIFYSCPLLSGYPAGRRSGSTCRYSKTQTTTRTASSRTVYDPCPSAPSGHRYNRRSGATCYYTSITTTTKAAPTTTNPTTTTTAPTTTKAAPTTAAPTTAAAAPSIAAALSYRVDYSMLVPAVEKISGHSLLTGNNQGQVSIEWNLVPPRGPTYHQIRYGVRDYSNVITRAYNPWSNPVSTGRLTAINGTYSYTVPNIRVNRYYEVQVRTRNGLSVSNWSASVYVYTTNSPMSFPTQVGMVQAAGFLDAHAGNSVHPSSAVGEYSYVICAEDLPPAGARPQGSSFGGGTRAEIVREIEASIELWESRIGTDGVVTAHHHTNGGNYWECDGNQGQHLRNKIRLKNAEAIRDKCGYSSEVAAMNGGCVEKDIPGQGRFGAADMFLFQSSVVAPQGSCSHMRGLVLHEAGHVFGLADRPLVVGESIMGNHRGFCIPTKHDFAAVRAIFLSRPSTSSSTTATHEDMTVARTTTTVRATSTTSPNTTTTAAAATTTTTAAAATAVTTANQPVTLWQIEARPTTYITNDVEWHLTSGNTFTYAGRTYTIDRIKTHRRGARIQATPDLEDHELPDQTQIRFWPTDTPTSVQTLRLGDAIVMQADHPWDLIWGRGRYPINIDRNTTWHIDLTIPAEAASSTTTTASVSVVASTATTIAAVSKQDGGEKKQ